MSPCDEKTMSEEYRRLAMENYSDENRNKGLFRPAIIGLALAGQLGGAMITEAAAADGADTVVLLERSGAYCRDDPNCINRLHPEIPTVARARPGQVIVFETRDAADSSILPPEQTPPRSPATRPRADPRRSAGSRPARGGRSAAPRR